MKNLKALKLLALILSGSCLISQAYAHADCDANVQKVPLNFLFQVDPRHPQKAVGEFVVNHGYALTSSGCGLTIVPDNSKRKDGKLITWFQTAFAKKIPYSTAGALNTWSNMYIAQNPHYSKRGSVIFDAQFAASGALNINTKIDGVTHNYQCPLAIAYGNPYKVKPIAWYIYPIKPSKSNDVIFLSSSDSDYSSVDHFDVDCGGAKLRFESSRGKISSDFIVTVLHGD